MQSENKMFDDFVKMVNGFAGTMLVGGTSFLLYAFVSVGWAVYVIIFFSALQGLVYPSLNALLSRMTDASNQGALQGGMASVASVAAIVGPLTLTQALAFGAERGTTGAAFLTAAAAIAMAMAVIYFGVLRRIAPAPVAETAGS